LAALSLDGAAYAAWQAQHVATSAKPEPLAFVRIEGAELSNADRLVAMLGSRAGQPFDRAQADRDTRRLAASGDYTRTDYQLVRTEQGEGLVFELEEKPWGPNYLRIGMDLNTDFSGHSAFNLKLSHNRHWLTRSGTEWRNRLQIGEEPLLYTELYQPLNWTASPANDWFASGYAGIHRRPFIRYAPDTGHKVVATVFEECRAMYRAQGPVEMKPVGEVEFAAGVGAMSDSGNYGPTRVCAGIVGHADLTLGDRVAPVLLSH